MLSLCDPQAFQYGQVSLVGSPKRKIYIYIAYRPNIGDENISEDIGDQSMKANVMCNIYIYNIYIYSLPCGRLQRVASLGILL